MSMEREDPWGDVQGDLHIRTTCTGSSLLSIIISLLLTFSCLELVVSVLIFIGRGQLSCLFDDHHKDDLDPHQAPLSPKLMEA